MRTIAVIALKGGSGKTTVAAHVALAAHLRGHKVLLADIDPQRSASEVLRARGDGAPHYVSTDGPGLFAAQLAAVGAGMDTMIIDTAAGAVEEVGQAIVLADLSLLVVRPTLLDLAATVRTMDVARRLRKPVMAVLNQAPVARDGVEAPTVKRALKALAFMRLPVAQRSSVILIDVLGYSLEEIAGVTDTSIAAIKAALHRGRARLRELAQEPDDRPAPALSEQQRSLLAAYVERFNARDFDAVRDMLADEVRLELVNKVRRQGRSAVAGYFHNYEKVDDWHFSFGCVEGRPAVLVRDPADAPGATAYFILLEWDGDRLVNIRDFRFARYTTEAADLFVPA